MIVDSRVVVGDITLGYGCAGTESAPPVVLLHALGEERSTWNSVIEVLADTHHVYAVDLRGHGGSDRPGAYSLELMRDDVIGFLDALDLSRVDLIGHSLGAFVAYLVAMTAPPGSRRWSWRSHRRRCLPTRREMRLLSPMDPWPLIGRFVAQLARQRNQPSPLWWDQLDRITARTLVIAGGPDSHLPQDQLLELADRIPNAEHATICAGHSVHENQLAEFLAAALPVLSH